MRSKVKLILTSAVVAALTVAGLSVAAGGGGDKSSSSATPRSSAAFTADGERNGSRDRERHRFRGDVADADVRAVLKDIREAVAKQAPAIAGPVIDKAADDKQITAAQADKLRQAAQDIADGKRPDIRGLGRDADVREVVHDAFAAAAEQAPGIAQPIIDEAVSDNKITAAQADRIKEMVKRGPPGPGRGRGHHGPHRGGPPRIADADVRAVLDDIHSAIAKQAADIVGPVIDKAEQDGKITAAQADRLRDATGKLAGGKPRGAPPRIDLRDADVRDVLHDAFEALAAKRAGIAKPIIDKALADKQITEAQASQLRAMMMRDKRGPGPGGPPGRGPSAQPEMPPAAGSPA